MIIVTDVADLIAEIIICILMSELYGEYKDIRAREYDIAKVSESISGDSTKISYWLLIIFAIAFIVFDVVETGLAYRDLYKTAKKDSCADGC